MHPHIEALFDNAESRYLKPEELNILSQYVESLPARLSTYRTLRDCELEVMQQVADQLQIELAQEKIEHLERALRNALLTLRYCAMGLLLNDESFVRERLMGWMSGTMRFYNSSTINAVLYRLLNQHLMEVLGPQPMHLLTPYLKLAQTLLYEQSVEPTPTK